MNYQRTGFTRVPMHQDGVTATCAESPTTLCRRRGLRERSLGPRAGFIMQTA